MFMKVHSSKANRNEQRDGKKKLIEVWMTFEEDEWGVEWWLLKGSEGEVRCLSLSIHVYSRHVLAQELEHGLDLAVLGRHATVRHGQRRRLQPAIGKGWGEGVRRQTDEGRGDCENKSEK